jgi:hypothetical protein
MTAEWNFNSSDLTNGAKYRASLLSGADDIPPVRGQDIIIPFRTGQTWVKKYFDSRTVVLSLYITGTSLTDKKANIDTLMSILGYRQHGLLIRTLPSAAQLQVYAEVIKPLSIVHKGLYLALGTVEFQLSDPFFRSSSLTSNTHTISLATTTYTLTNPGTAQVQTALITLTAPLSSPTITNTTNGISVQYNAALATGSVVIDCSAMTAVLNGSTNVIGSIIHTGDPCFMTLEAGANAMSVTDGTHTTGTVQFTFYAPYF